MNVADGAGFVLKMMAAILESANIPLSRLRVW
jgi:hypothetical protein